MNFKNYCQSCGMPMGDSKEILGTNCDGSKNEEYCKYCFGNGKFKANISMEEMIEVCVPHMVSANPNMKEDEARKMMQEFFPKLKRWNSV
ncbi:MAG: zinc ribbon domain-containing protein [Clostridium sp.]